MRTRYWYILVYQVPALSFLFNALLVLHQRILRPPTFCKTGIYKFTRSRS
jgi:hypothetical protein